MGHMLRERAKRAEAQLREAEAANAVLQRTVNDQARRLVEADALLAKAVEVGDESTVMLSKLNDEHFALQQAREAARAPLLALVLKWREKAEDHRRRADTDCRGYLLHSYADALFDCADDVEAALTGTTGA